MIRKIFAACVVSIAAFSAQGTDDLLPTRVLSSIKAVCPAAQSERMVTAVGSLGVGKLRDAAIVTSCESDQELLLLILREQPDGTFKTALRSQAWSWNNRSEISLEFRKNTLVLSEQCAYNCNPERWDSSYKFKMRDGELILIGEDHSETVVSGKNHQFETSSGVSFNLLTQMRVDWTKSTSHGYSEKKSAFKVPTPLVVSQFNLDTCTVNRSCMPVGR